MNYWVQYNTGICGARTSEEYYTFRETGEYEGETTEVFKTREAALNRVQELKEMTYRYCIRTNAIAIY